MELKGRVHTFHWNAQFHINFLDIESTKLV